MLSVYVVFTLVHHFSGSSDIYKKNINKEKEKKRLVLKLLSWVSVCFRYGLPNIWLKLALVNFSETIYFNLF